MSLFCYYNIIIHKKVYFNLTKLRKYTFFKMTFFMGVKKPSKFSYDIVKIYF